MNAARAQGAHPCAVRPRRPLAPACRGATRSATRPPSFARCWRCWLTHMTWAACTATSRWAAARVHACFQAAGSPPAADAHVGSVGAPCSPAHADCSPTRSVPPPLPTLNPVPGLLQQPDNCLMLDEGDDAPLKLADWGFATFTHPGKKLSAMAGTCYYIAPVRGGKRCAARRCASGCVDCTALAVCPASPAPANFHTPTRLQLSAAANGTRLHPTPAPRRRC